MRKMEVRSVESAHHCEREVWQRDESREFQVEVVIDTSVHQEPEI